VQIDTSKLKFSTKSLVSALLGFGAVMQVPAVSQFVLGITKEHPHVAATLTSMAGAAMLLHNPQVQEALGIKQTVTTEEVTLKPEAGQ
jgi:hypothetical protein